MTPPRLVPALRLPLAVAAGLVLGCAAAPPGPDAPMPAAVAPCPPTPVPSYAPATVTAEQVAGEWVGLSSDPRDAVIGTCDRVPFVLRLAQEGTRLTGQVVRLEAYVYLFDMALRGEGTVAGTLQAGRVRLAGEALDAFASPAPGKVAVRYNLRFEPARGHLVGTLDARPVWLLPRRAQGPCPSPRPCDPVI